MSERLTRQQIYDRIRETSKDSYILEEMQRLGFWDTSMPAMPEVIINRETALNQELSKLLAQDRKFRNQDAMLKEMRKERMKKAKEKRENTKQKNKQQRLEKAARWKQMQLGQIIYLGKGVSAGLNKTNTDTALLQKNNLPVFDSIMDLAENMKVDLAALRYLLFQRKVSKINHYHTFEIPKKSGGKRVIAAPKKRLKYLQSWILETILNKIMIHEPAHGFVKDRSILTNARVHVEQDIVINVDLKDFFPGIDYKRVKGLFCKLGYSEQMATIFALICTQAETKTVNMDGITYYVQQSNRFLPQGSPASPAISNLIAYKLDKRLQGLAQKFGFTYTRYADDLTFSASKESEQYIARFLYFVKQIIQTEGLTINPAKTHVMRKGNQQKVTGIVVNKKANIDRCQLRRFRAMLHHLETDGWSSNCKWGQAQHLIHAIEGYIHFIKMVNPEKSKKFEEQLERIKNKHGYPQIERMHHIREEKPVEFKQPEIKQEIKKENPPQKEGDWWNIFS